MKKTDLSFTKLDAIFAAVQKLSKVQRILILVGVFTLTIGAFVYFSYLPKFDRIEDLTQKSEKLDRELRAAKLTAMSKPKFEKKMKEAREKFELAKSALPQHQEIPSLLTGISRSGHEAGLDFLLFKPVAEVKKDFFAEIPVEMSLSGSYHDVAVFFEKVARLSRIVNIRNIEMASAKDGSKLTTGCTAVTYRFIQPTSQGADSNAKPAK